MNSSQIFDLIEQIAATPKKTEKEQLLKEHDCPELRRVLVAAYNPRINYYIKKVPTQDEQYADNNFDCGTYEFLDNLTSRKITGNQALEALAKYLSVLNEKSQQLLIRIIKRDLRAGFSESTINKCFPKLIPEYPYMRCSLLSKVDTSDWDWSRGVFSQTKMDGMFCNLTVVDGCVTMQSRQGSEFPIESFSELAEHMATYGHTGCQYHGEILVMDGDKPLPREIGNGMLNSVLKGGVLEPKYYTKFIAWDEVGIHVINGETKCSTPYYQRLKYLLSIGKSKVFDVVQTRVVHSLEEAYQHYQEMLAEGQEGTIVKEANMLWRDGTSKQCLKLKLEFEVDLRITGFTKGNGKNADTFGSISMSSSDDLVQVDVSGMSDDLRMYCHLHREELVDTIGTVKANDITKSSPASLYLPRLVELRLDKTEADSFEQVVEQRENAKRGAK